MTKRGTRKTAAEAVQKLLPFDDLTPQEPSTVPLPEMTVASPPVAAEARKHSAPSEEALAAFEGLKGWLLDPLTGRPVTEASEEALHALGKALLEGKNGWLHAAEDRLAALALRNGPTSGDDIPVGAAPEGDDFQKTIENLLDHLHERLTFRAR